MDKKVDFRYGPMFDLQKDDTQYYLLTRDYVSEAEFKGKKILVVESAALTLLARRCVHDGSFMMRRSHNEKLADIVRDSEATSNDRFAALCLLKNAQLAAQGILPLCQDTGTATFYAHKGQAVWTDCDDRQALSLGVYQTYTTDNLRYSQNAPITLYEEKNTACNLPAQINIEAVEGDEYRFLCIVKGGGGSNKSQLFQKTKAVLSPEALEAFLTEKIAEIGTAACPPYHIAFAIGGTSPEMTMQTAKLASTHFYDNLPTTGDESARAFRDLELERRLYEAAQKIGLGAQFGGKYLALDIRVIRLPRHGGSCPIGMAVGCSADRNVKAKINKDGIWIEKLDDNPWELVLNAASDGQQEPSIQINLNQPVPDILRELSKYSVGTRVSLTGKIIVARDIAHARLKQLLDDGQELPEYVKNHPIFYAGPAKKPSQYACGSMGPTTSARMDPYVELFQKHGASLLMIGKGNRSDSVRESCKKHGGFYLGTMGGIAAYLSAESIRNIRCLDWPELGMEAVYEIDVENFPAFILTDDKGNDFFAQTLKIATRS